MTSTRSARPTPRPWPGSWRSLALGSAVIFVVILAVAGVLWFQASMVSQEGERELVKAVVEARRKDMALRQEIRTLNPVIEEAREVQAEATPVLGDDAVQLEALASALATAESLIAEVGANPLEVPNVRAAAQASLRQDEDQLALVEPVRSKLASAIADANVAVQRTLMAGAMSELTLAASQLESAATAATSVVNTVTSRITELTAALTPPVVPPADDGDASSDGVDPVGASASADGSGSGEVGQTSTTSTPSPTVESTTSSTSTASLSDAAATSPSTTSTGTAPADPADSADPADPADPADSADPADPPERAEVEAEIARLTLTANALRPALSHAQSLLTASFDTSDVETVRATARAYWVEFARLTAAVAEAKAAEPELLADGTASSIPLVTQGAIAPPSATPDAPGTPLP